MSRIVRSYAIRFLSFLLLCSVTHQLFPITRNLVLGQSTDAQISGRIQDEQDAGIPGVEVVVENADTGITYKIRTNSEGFYSFPHLLPGRYLMSVRKDQFRTISVTGIVLHVQDDLSRNFTLRVGSSSESITVTADQNNINTTDGSVSTVIDRQFVENIPLNGRSFQDLLTLAPGVALVGNFANGGYGGIAVGDRGEMTVNGQRTEANNFTVDGVSANTGSAAMSGAGISGSLPGETVLGTTQSIVSIDALQEFRASTSTYSAEYGRTPGGQFSFSTRSGTNAWHGSAFDYFRNDVLDANNWFNNYANPQIPRQAERQNDFGGTLGGPIIIPGLYSGRDKTFFFFSYEGLRLTVPRPYQQYSVPDLTLRQQAPAAIQPFLNAFPKPNGAEDGLNDGLAYLNVAYSSPSSLDNVGIRLDHSFSERLKLFGRYANTPSSGWSYYYVPGNKQITAINVRTLTVGATSSITPSQANEFRLNITQNNFDNDRTSTSFDGATPFDFSNVAGPNGTTAKPLGSFEDFGLYFGGSSEWVISGNINSQRQYNITDAYTWSHAAHQFKFGVDWRRLTTYVAPTTNVQAVFFYSEASVLANSADFVLVGANTIQPVTPVYHNFSAFTQDEWKATQRLSLSLGLRWDINPAPGNLTGPPPYTVDQITNLAATQLAPASTPLWKTDWLGFAPRIGLAFQLRQAPGHETVLRTGFGLFYDMGNAVSSDGFNGYLGYSSFSYLSGVSLPLTSAQVTLSPPSVAPPYNNTVYAFDPNLKLPYTMQWNLAVEQGLGANQTLTVSYVGSGGRKLLSTLFYYPLNNPNFSSGDGLDVTANGASSNYDALQVKYQKSMSHGVQALGSYTWSHSIDDLSSNFFINGSLLRGSSDFDIRNNFQAAVTYDVPGTYSNAFASAALRHWGLDTRISARSALPVDVTGSGSTAPNGQREYFHPNLVPGQPIYLYGSQYPGGRVINYNAFVDAPAGVEGNFPRNYLRGFGAVQADLALRRDFPIHEGLHLQFRAEAFNVFNHANFGAIYSYLPYGPNLFGYAYQTLNNSLGGLNSLYQSGGPRSLQLMLKLAF